MNKEKEYIEPEIIKGNNKEGFSKKATNYGKSYASDKASEQMNDMKKAMFVKGGTLLLPYILGAIIFLFIIFGIIFLLFAHPFDYIIAGVLALFMLRVIFSFSKMFGGKK